MVLRWTSAAYPGSRWRGCLSCFNSLKAIYHYDPYVPGLGSSFWTSLPKKVL